MDIYGEYIMNETISTLVETAAMFSVTDTGSRIYEYFEAHSSSKGIVIMKDADNPGKPIGLIMRNHFYQMIGKQYGFSIYMNRSIKLLVKTEILCLDISCDLAQFGLEAMKRKEENVYDFVIILKEGCYFGVVSITNFLTAMSEVKQREIELLNDQQKILEEANEQEKQLREEIEVKNKSIRNLMNNAEQGFLSFTEALTIYEEYSSVCNVIFGKPIAGINFGTLMNAYLDEEQHKLLINTLDSLFKQERKIKAKAYLRLLPDEFTADDRYIHIKYKIISFKHPKMLMAILTDITDKKALEKKDQKEKNNMKLVLSAVQNKSEVLEAIDDAKLFFSENLSVIIDSYQPLEDSIQSLFRVIHTMKGDFSLHSFYNTAAELHKIEDKLAFFSKAIANITGEIFGEFVKAINFEKIIDKDLSIIKDFLGEGFLQSEKNISISYERIECLLRMIKERFTGDEKRFLISQISKLADQKLNDLLKSYNEYIQTLALRFDKSISDIEVTGDVVYINRQQYSKFLKSLIHIFRNIVDHAIEMPEERIEKGKDEQGQIRCHISQYDAGFVLEISDDGHGINSDIIIKRALEKGIYKKEDIIFLSRKDIIQTIFLEAFSTADKVSMVSGRGIGLSAVKNEVEALGGSIEVTSEVDRGTTFKMTLI